MNEREQAMTELDAAMADRTAEADARRLHRLQGALYHAERELGIKQGALVTRTGLTRETIRRHVEDERIRRGEIQPTRRYLEEQAKRAEAARKRAATWQARSSRS